MSLLQVCDQIGLIDFSFWYNQRLKWLGQFHKKKSQDCAKKTTSLASPNCYFGLTTLKSGHMEARLYKQVADKIPAMIATEGFTCGDRLPSERELSARLEVSRASHLGRVTRTFSA